MKVSVSVILALYFLAIDTKMCNNKSSCGHRPPPPNSKLRLANHSDIWQPLYPQGQRWVLKWLTGSKKTASRWRLLNLGVCSGGGLTVDWGDTQTVTHRLVIQPSVKGIGGGGVFSWHCSKCQEKTQLFSTQLSGCVENKERRRCLTL